MFRLANITSYKRIVLIVGGQTLPTIKMTTMSVYIVLTVGWVILPVIEATARRVRITHPTGLVRQF